MTRGHPAPAPSCMHVSFVPFVLFLFCSLLFVKSKTRQINEQFSKKQKQKKRLDYVC